MTTTRTEEVSVGGSVSGFVLQDLRWLVQRLESCAPNTHVTLYVDRPAHPNQFDAGSSRLSARVPIE